MQLELVYTYIMLCRKIETEKFVFLESYQAFNMAEQSNQEPAAPADVDMLVGISKHIAGLADRKGGRLSTTLSSTQETIREKMMKYREERQLRFQELQLTHRQICDMVAIYLDLEPNDVLEGVADDAEHLRLMNSLIDPNGRKAIMFYYQDGPPYPIGKKEINKPVCLKQLLCFCCFRIRAT